MFRRLWIALAIVLSGAAFIPYFGLTTQEFRWQKYADVYEPALFLARLAGAQETPPVDTNASGLAAFAADAGGAEIHYVLWARNIRNVTAGHIHCAPRSIAGPVGVTLFTGSPTASDERIVDVGTITQPDPNNPCGWTAVADIVEAIKSDDTYVNIHTTEHPAGEIRGQIGEFLDP